MTLCWRRWLSYITVVAMSAGWGAAAEDSSRATLTLHAAATGREVVVHVEIADDVAERSRGLMGREGLAEHEGMWFVFPEETIQRVWMKNMRFALDIVFLSTKGCIVALLQQIPPCTSDVCPVYHSAAPSRYMLELPTGFVEKQALRVGDCLKAFVDKNMTKSVS